MRQLTGVVKSITEDENGKRLIIIELCMPVKPTGPYNMEDVLKHLNNLEKRKQAGEYLDSRELEILRKGREDEPRYRREMEAYLQEYPRYNSLHLGRVQIEQEDGE